MRKEIHRLNLSDAPHIAAEILQNYKRDRVYFEHYSPKFNNDFLSHLEEKVNALIYQSSLRQMENKMESKRNQIEITIGHFRPIVKAIAALIEKVRNELNFQFINTDLDELEVALHKKCLWEILRTGKKTAEKLELYIDELIDQGFIVRILSDLKNLLVRLDREENELAMLKREYNSIADEYTLIAHQLKEYLDTIIESSTEVFGKTEKNKIESYNIEKILNFSNRTLQ